MKENFTLKLKCLLFLLNSAIAFDGFNQSAGDFQTKNATGNWSDYTAWNRHNGTSWVPATIGQVPGTTNSVFVQAGHTIAVDNANAVCKDLDVNGDNSSKIAFSVSTAILNVKGNMLLASVTHNCFGIWSAGAKIVFSGSTGQSFTNLSAYSAFLNTEVNKSAGTLSLAGNALSIDGTLTLTSGNLSIGANGTLIINGPLLSTSGTISGTTTSDISITGTTGSSVVLPVSANISLRNITVSGTRTLIMDGSHNINLNGTFTIANGATYDNGGESQVTNSGGTVVVSGKFLNRDKDNFCGTNGALSSSFNPILNAGCTIEFARVGDQSFTVRSDFKNITFSGSGTKTPSSSFTPSGALYITGDAIVDASGHNIGDGTAITDFKMDGGRLILGTGGTQPGMDGSYNLTGGIIEFSGPSGQTIRPKSYQNIEVTGAGVGNSNGNITLNANGTFTVKNSGVFLINDNNITGVGGTQTVTVESGGIFRCGNNQGFNGYTATLYDNSSVGSSISKINLKTGSTVEYMKAGDQPITNANGLTYSNLIIAGTGIKKATGTLTIKGNLTKAGTSIFDHNNGTVLLNGTNQTFAGLTYNNLILTGGTKSASGSSTIIDSIKIIDGTNLSISTNDVITLHSDAIKTARVGQIGTGTITYTGAAKFMVERYIPARRAWRFLSVPTISSTQTIKQAWQEGATSSSSDPKTGYGIQITSDRASWAADGFDALSFSPSVKTYNPVTDTYSGITSTNSPFDPAKGGFMTFIRGDRSATTLGSAVTGTTLRTAGALFTGDQPPVNLIPGQFIPVNNPYASALDLRNISRSNSISYYVWDPKRGGGYGFGGFTTLSWDGSGDYDAVPANTGSYGATNNYIASGQAFFVSGTSGSIRITENAKTAATLPAIPFTPVGVPLQKLRANLHSINANGTFLADGVLISFGNNYSNAVDGMDARKIMNASENLSIKRENIHLVVERRNPLLAGDTIFFHLTGLRQQPYYFEFIPAQLSPKGLDAYLEDCYLAKRTLLNLNDTARINFAVDNNPASAAPGRFRIVFDAAGAALPVTFTNVKAYPENDNIAVEWKVANETGIINYEVERSPGGTMFIPAAVITAQHTAVSNYKWTDEQPVTGYNYYRIKSTGSAGEVQYSKTIKAWAGNSNNGITVYSNPSNNGIIHLQFNSQPAGRYQLGVVDNAGQVIQSAIVQRTNSSGSIETIQLEKSIASGRYLLHIIRPDNTEVNIAIIYEP
ncbi:hypothetical protein FW778_19245 [Ginsengibacter hankyongi]|uniref:Secretion system C-terminal sorting domain-containing protein n=1 Tax=Ginsengibacter hankyongi TaxID=2607284 RepID=A0A5J5IFP9_9BACT|nr:hypothetical protein [Ginsengibacter hankyongi]KAA9036366.1 hypothetical protein FW778_19245 [Ginsengibacter hankyongi]